MCSLDVAESRGRGRKWLGCLDFIVERMRGSGSLGAGGAGPKARFYEEQSPWHPDRGLEEAKAGTRSTSETVDRDSE